MSKIWSFIIIISIIFAALTGKLDIISKSISEGAANTIENILTIMGLTCFWTGIFNILRNTEIISKLSKIIKVITKRLFKPSEITDEIMEDISLNITSDMLGVGNAATTYSIEAINKMQKINKKDTPNDSMTTFILLNTASIQLLPTTVISLRTMFGSKNPSSIIIPVWIVSVFALLIGLLAIKILNKVVKE